MGRTGDTFASYLASGQTHLCKGRFSSSFRKTSRITTATRRHRCCLRFNRWRPDSSSSTERTSSSESQPFRRRLLASVLHRTSRIFSRQDIAVVRDFQTPVHAFRHHKHDFSHFGLVTQRLQIHSTLLRPRSRGTAGGTKARNRPKPSPSSGATAHRSLKL